MNTTSDKQKKYEDYFINETDNFDLEYETKMIMYRFLSVVDEIMEEENISKKKLASMIGTSPSYITQLFNGSKTINLSTLAKIQNALDLKFKINESSKIEEINNKKLEDYINNNIGKEFFLVYKKLNKPKYEKSIKASSTIDELIPLYA